MQLKNNVYVFSPSIAFEMAQNSTFEDQVFFYDGDELVDAPNNCIHVPMENFVKYFLTSPYPYPQEVNFDTMNFSIEVQNTILENLTKALESVKNEKTQQLNKVLDTEITIKNAQESVSFMLEYIYINNFVTVNIPFVIVYKLLEAAKLISIQEIPLQKITYTLIEKLFSDIEAQSLLVQKHFYLMHLRYLLSLLRNDKKNHEFNTKVYFDALAEFEDIEQFETDFPLIKALFQEEDLKEYIRNFSKSLFTDDFFEQKILKQKHAVFKVYYVTGMHYERGEAYKEIFYALKEVFTLALEKGLGELAFYLYTPVLMSWSGVSQTQEELKYFNQVIEKPLETFIKLSIIPKYNIKENKKSANKKKKTRVAFLQERIINYSIYKVFYSLVNSLSKQQIDNYEFIIYDLNFQEFGGSNPQTVKELKKLGITYVDLHKECSKEKGEFYSIIEKSLQVRRKIIKDKVDVLIGMHSRPEYNFLFTTRTAPMQIYWSHGNYEYSTCNIDKYIGHHLPLEIIKGYEYHSFDIPYENQMLNPNVDMDIVKKTRAQWSEEKVIIGVIGRLTKIDSLEYLQTILSVMQKNPNVIYLACGGGEPQNIQDKVSQINASMLKRFYFPGHIDAHVFGHVIDIFADTFPFHQGNSKVEFASKGKPTLTIINDPDSSRHHEEKFAPLKKAICHAIGDACYPIKNKLCYESLLNKLVNDRRLCADIGEFNKKTINKYYIENENTFLSTLEK